MKRYKATFDYSLDLIKLREAYEKAYRNNRFSYIEGDKEYCNRIINVSFKFGVKEFNRVGKDIYLRLGARFSDVVWEDCIGRIEGKIVAVKVNHPILHEALEEHDGLPKCFTCVDNQYRAKQNIKSIKAIGDIRSKLYSDGFYCNGTHYVRWKRSAGSARVGRCMFIDERLYGRLHRWELCGLNIRPNSNVDLAALESYISLTSSSIIDTLEITPQNILLIEDYESVFSDDAINVSEENGRLQAQREEVEIRNSIYDGESLIDPSLMGQYSTKGMVLLRNRFFKSCAFNCNIQQWFCDHNITDIGQIHGKTRASRIEQIKLITTPSSIKYLKFATYDEWLDCLEPKFGLVKYEKPPHFLGGRLVPTHYQLINSLQISTAEIEELLSPTFEFMDLVRREPAVLRYWIKFHIEDELEITPVKSKTDVIYKLMSLNEDFYKTKLYHDFVTDFLKSFAKDLKCGHILVNGNYSVLCGNPIEMLKSAIGVFDGISTIEKGCVYSRRFEWGKTLLGSRSPHPSISNVLLVTNRYNADIERYMNPTNEIVYINSIGENILQQLAGSDFDSDSLLLTDNSVLISAAQRNYGRFKVAVCSVGGTKRQRKYSNEDKSDLDIKTSKNLIGDIINLAQCLNSIIWDKIAGGSLYRDTPYGVDEVYLDTCKLSIMSGIEIDRAKKEFVVDNAKELAILRKKYNVKRNDKAVKPKFFSHLARNKGYYAPGAKAYENHCTSMDFLQHSVNSYRHRSRSHDQRNFLRFSEVIDKSGFQYGRVYDKQIYRILNSVDRMNEQLKAIYSCDDIPLQERYAEANSIRQGFIDYLGRLTFNRDTMIALLQTIEKPENKKYSRLLFYTLFGYPNTSFYQVVKASSSHIPVLAESSDGDIYIYKNKFAKTCKNEPFFSTK